MRRNIFRFLAISAVVLVSNATLTSQPTTQRRSVGKVLDEWVSKTEEPLVAAAEAMPEERYGFVPSAGKFDGVRSFAEQVKHLAAANYSLASAVLGEKPPHQEVAESAPDSIQSKPQIMQYLRGSFAYLHRAAAAVNEENETLTINSMNNQTRPGLLVDALAHCWNHYGQMVEYLRMNGIAPPGSK